MSLTITTLPSPVGAMTLVLEHDTIVICEFADRQARVDRQLAQYFTGEAPMPTAAPTAIAAAFAAYFKGERDALNGLKARPVGTRVRTARLARASGYSRRQYKKLWRIGAGVKVKRPRRWTGKRPQPDQPRVPVSPGDRRGWLADRLRGRA